MRGHLIVCDDDALAARIISELSDAEISVLHSAVAGRPCRCGDQDGARRDLRFG
jgi:hypothetical protein